ncbi:MAG: thioredoxin family protein, partial [Acidimicrobiales bacterium]
MPNTERPSLPDGIVAVVKRDCPTCTLIEPVLQRGHGGSLPLIVYSQDDPGFPAGLPVRDDRDLVVSYHWDVETVPTLLRIEGGAEAARLVDWDREAWQGFFADDELGADLPEWRPGCGSLSVDPTRADELRARFSGSGLQSRRVD